MSNLRKRVAVFSVHYIGFLTLVVEVLLLRGLKCTLENKQNMINTSCALLVILIFFWNTEIPNSGETIRVQNRVHLNEISLLIHCRCC